MAKGLSHQSIAYPKDEAGGRKILEGLTGQKVYLARETFEIIADNRKPDPFSKNSPTRK